MSPQTRISRTALVRKATQALEAGDDQAGFCCRCGYGHDGVEPDVDRDTCERCGAAAVAGAEQILVLYAL
jgi:hypothetical protein